MRIISRRTLRLFTDSPKGQKGGAALKAALDSWFHEVSKADWRSTADIKKRYAHASIINAERVVFNIKGNDYRLIASVDFERGAVWIKWIGAHGDYDRINAATVEHNGT
nr:type II toxin-antitoxin system HigB family toxin [Rhizobium sp. Q54]